MTDITKVRELRDVQGLPGNCEHDPYMRGLYNGLELACAVMEDREPAYKSAGTRQPEPLREAHELLGKVYALMQRGEVGLTHGAGGGCWVLPDRIGAWLEAQDAARAAGVGATSTDQEWKDFQAWQEELRRRPAGVTPSDGGQR